MASAKVLGVLLAAGESRRFGGNKLEALLDGQMLGLHVARTVAGLGLARLVAVCHPKSLLLNRALQDLGFKIIVNLVPEAGLSYSLRIAASEGEADDADALMIVLADMPDISPAHFVAMIEAFDGTQCVASAIGSQRMPPAIFPCDQFGALMSMDGDVGARALLQDGLAIEGNAIMLADVDTRAHLAALRAGT